MERWMGDGEESGGRQKQDWCLKLGVLLKLHGKINCQWPYPPVELNTNPSGSLDAFGHPWAYKISDFPSGYKLFSVERQAKGNDPPRKDHYLCGMFFFSFFHMTLLSISF